ncbi:MAG: hypothetical protein ABJG33_00170 [Balneola sp.]
MDKNEVTMFGTDYDGAISAGEDGWNCNQCQCWNKEEDVFCVHCDRSEKYGNWNGFPDENEY